MRALVLLLVLLGLGCVRRAPAPGGESWRAQCEACLASGKVWTGGRCEATCLMDVSCFKTQCPDQPVKESTDW